MQPDAEVLTYIYLSGAGLGLMLRTFTSPWRRVR
jgi:hypothetical protein